MHRHRKRRALAGAEDHAADQQRGESDGADHRKLRQRPDQRQGKQNPARVDPNGAVVDPTELQKPVAERRDTGLRFRIALGMRYQHADPRELAGRRLRRRRARHAHGRAAEKRDELAPLHDRSSGPGADFS